MYISLFICAQGKALFQRRKALFQNEKACLSPRSYLYRLVQAAANCLARGRPVPEEDHKVRHCLGERNGSEAVEAQQKGRALSYRRDVGLRAGVPWRAAIICRLRSFSACTIASVPMLCRALISVTRCDHSRFGQHRHFCCDLPGVVSLSLAAFKSSIGAKDAASSAP